MTVEIRPTTGGQDIESTDDTRDAHVRLERLSDGELEVTADVFDSSVEDATRAHVESESWGWGTNGAAQITRFLRDHGFDVTIRFT